MGSNLAKMTLKRNTFMAFPEMYEQAELHVCLCWRRARELLSVLTFLDAVLPSQDDKARCPLPDTHLRAWSGGTD